MKELNIVNWLTNMCHNNVGKLIVIYNNKFCECYSWIEDIPKSMLESEVQAVEVKSDKLVIIRLGDC